MNNNIDLKGLWNKQEADIPDTKELFEKINAYKKRRFGKMTFLLAAITYFTTLMWIAFNWFYLRPRQIKKQRAKTDELIIKLEMLNRQISENE